jgi:hypothetical protein
MQSRGEILQPGWFNCYVVIHEGQNVAPRLFDPGFESM